MQIIFLLERGYENKNQTTTNRNENKNNSILQVRIEGCNQ
jgi:hypothetical protein